MGGDHIFQSQCDSMAVFLLLLPGTRYSNSTDLTHLSLEKDAPVSRTVDRAGRILCRPILGGLHHQYGRI
jgi:hypothetical protein